MWSVFCLNWSCVFPSFVIPQSVADWQFTFLWIFLGPKSENGDCECFSDQKVKMVIVNISRPKKWKWWPWIFLGPKSENGDQACCRALLVRVCCRLKDVAPYRARWREGLEISHKIHPRSLFNTNLLRIWEEIHIRLEENPDFVLRNLEISQNLHKEIQVSY